MVGLDLVRGVERWVSGLSHTVLRVTRIQRNDQPEECIVTEKVIFSEDSIVVTSAKVSIKGDSYFVGQIVSSKVRYSDEIDRGKRFRRRFAIVGSIALGVAVGIEVKSLAVALILIIAGIIAAFILIKPKYRLYHIYLGVSSREVDAYSSTSRAFVQRVSEAIDQAVALRV